MVEHTTIEKKVFIYMAHKIGVGEAESLGASKITNNWYASIPTNQVCLMLKDPFGQVIGIPLSAETVDMLIKELERTQKLPRHETGAPEGICPS
jgi:hypothetical protein